MKTRNSEPATRNLFRGGFSLFPIALGGFDDEPLFDGAGGHSHIAHFSIHDCFDALQVGEEASLRNGSDVRADAALLLGFATAPNNAALHGAFSGQFTNSCHNEPY